ncbi:alpha-amylase [Leptolyngbya sp. BL0902]|uniref:glycoside hydrolase family 13 protein n=1 Tax=Leptolyngbya sp. BL0902 TaxID=1115757 RepID=UPI0018E8982A|nr:glycoside hydrolase family 13 protein [Leptolyngbya sp. BL0902]QQE65970.1 alpha-amylase [Leptolyngbya sp. BL0902]
MAIHTPDWVKQAVFYQIFPDRMARTQRRIDDPAMAVALEPWDTPPTPSGYKGGDLWGVLEKLDYLQDLGITAIYFTPIFQSACNHRYHTHDYYQVDPLLGGNAAFFDLLEAAHQRGLKVVLDGVFNHASRGFFFFNDILENGPHSPWIDWFRVEGWPLSAYDGSKPANYQSWVDNRALPTFNHDHPAAREYLMRVGEYWVRQGIDGWRLDVPYEVKTAGFWQEFRDRIKAINPDAYIVGEVWTDARQWLDGTQFDGVMNYLFTGPTIAFAAGDRVRMDLAEKPHYFPYPALDAAGYGAKMQALLGLYPWDIQLTQLNLLSSHDVARMYSVVGEDEASVVLATVLLLTFPGAPSLYYGDEVGLPGELDPDCRRTFPPESAWNRSLLEIHKALIALRHQHPALRTGTYQVGYAEGHTYSFARTLNADSQGSETITVVLNAGETATTIAPPHLQPSAPPGDWHTLWAYRSAQVGPDGLHLPPRSAWIGQVNP